MIGFAKMQETHLRVMSWSLLWLGCALVVVGFVTNSMWNNVPWAEAVLLGGLGLAAALIAWALKRLTGAALATSTALVWLLALVYYAGFASFAAVALLAVASLALGSLFIPADWPARGTLSILGTGADQRGGGLAVAFSGAWTRGVLHRVAGHVPCALARHWRGAETDAAGMARGGCRGSRRHVAGGDGHGHRHDLRVDAHRALRRPGRTSGAAFATRQSRLLQ